MNTRVWGPAGWVFLDAIAFNYPVQINHRSTKHRELKRRYKELFENLQYTLPCKYCRQSYKRFLNELPIDRFLDSRADLTYWLYLIHDKVNHKLLHQEQQALQERYADIDKKRSLTRTQRYRERAKARRQTCFTKPSPTYKAYCKRVEKYRAKCAKKRGHVPSCRLPSNTKAKGKPMKRKNY